MLTTSRTTSPRTTTLTTTTCHKDTQAMPVIAELDQSHVSGSSGSGAAGPTVGAGVDSGQASAKRWGGGAERARPRLM